MIRYAIVLLGSVATILITLQLFGIAVTQLLVCGAFATILVGIAAQQSLSTEGLARADDLPADVLAEGPGNAGSVAKRVSLLLAEPLVQPAQHRPAANH